MGDADGSKVAAARKLRLLRCIRPCCCVKPPVQKFPLAFARKSVLNPPPFALLFQIVNRQS
jgi:hypothetical protein